MTLREEDHEAWHYHSADWPHGKGRRSLYLHVSKTKTSALPHEWRPACGHSSIEPMAS